MVESSTSSGEQKGKDTLSRAHLFPDNIRPLHLLPSFSLAIIILAIFGPALRIWDEHGPYLHGSLREACAFAALLLIFPLFVTKIFSAKKVLPLLFHPGGYVLALVALLATEWFVSPYSFPHEPRLRSESILFITCMYFALKFYGPKLLDFTKRFEIFLIALPCLTLLTIFFHEAAGRLLVSDDHPVMLYRLALLKENFPDIPFASPLWNGFYDARDFFAVGVLSVFFTFSPLIYAFDVESIYNVIIGLLCFGVVPLSAYLAARVLALNTTARILTTLLSVSQSLLWYRWALKYGTCAFIMSAALTPLVYALALKMVQKKSSATFIEVMGFYVVGSLAIFWSPSAVALVPAGMLILLYFRTALSQRWFKLLLLLFLVAHLFWIALFVNVSKVTSFTAANSEKHHQQASQVEMRADQGPKKPEGLAEPRVIKASHHKLTPGGVLKSLRDFGQKANPLLLLLLLPGVFLLKERRQRYVIGAGLIWLFILGTIVPPLKAQLEFERMLLFMLQLGCLPVAAVLSHYLEGNFLRACALSFLFSGLLAVCSILENRTTEEMHFLSSDSEDFIEALREEPGTGRIAFLGFNLHSLDEGHIAPLALFANRPLLASSPFHNLWWYKELLPHDVTAGGEEAIEKYLDNLNVTAIVTNNKRWKRYATKRANWYKKVFENQHFTLYSRNHYHADAFIAGSGEILSENTSSVTLRLHLPGAIIKYRYLDFLETDSTCELSGVPIEPDFIAISLASCETGKQITIRAKTHLRRLFHELEK